MQALRMARALLPQPCFSFVNSLKVIEAVFQAFLRLLIGDDVVEGGIACHVIEAVRVGVPAGAELETQPVVERIRVVLDDDAAHDIVDEELYAERAAISGLSLTHVQRLLWLSRPTGSQGSIFGVAGASAVEVQTRPKSRVSRSARAAS